VRPGNFEKGGVRLGGRGEGKVNAREKTMFWHDPDTWKELWCDVGQRTGTEWDVEASFAKEEMETWVEWKGIASLEFCVRRV